MNYLNICRRTLPAYGHVFFDNDEDWIAFRTGFSYLDLAVPYEILCKKYFDNKFLSKNDSSSSSSLPKLEVAADGEVWRLRNGRSVQHPDDCIYHGCERRRDFYSHALSKNKKDRIGTQLFNLFCRNKEEGEDWWYLKSGESAVRFLNMATILGVPNRMAILELHFLWCFYHSIIIGIHKVRHEHPLLLLKCWNLFCVRDLTRLSLFSFIPDAEHLEFMLQVANRARFDFWGMRYGNYRFAVHIVQNLINREKFKWVELLLKYGFAIEKGTPDGESVHWCSIPIGGCLAFDWSRPISNKFLVWLLATVYVTNRSFVTHPGFVELYHKLYLSLPLPSEPPSVVRANLLRVSFNETLQTPNPPFLSSLEEMIEVYVKCGVHPSDSSGITPRKLSHLSRCVIRDRLRANYQLPEAIDDFPLPTHIKEFLRLEF